MADGFNKAMINRSLRAIKTELEFLVDSNVISQAQFDAISGQLPANAASARALPAAPTHQLSALSVNAPASTPEPEKKASAVGYYGNTAANQPPPAYPTPPAAPAGPPTLCHATAMYQYNAQDAGDLALIPNDKIVVTEYMNNEWWKGRNERTGQEGIFPASYVRREEKAMAPTHNGYGNMPLDVSNGNNGAVTPQQPNAPHEPSKFEEGGKKFGKKLGNAAVFGAGATIGSKIVNGIF